MADPPSRLSTQRRSVVQALSQQNLLDGNGIPGSFSEEAVSPSAGFLSQSAAFESLSRDGFVTLEQLPDVLRAQGLTCSDKEVFEAVDELRMQGVLPNMAENGEGKVTAADVREVYAHIAAYTEGLQKPSASTHVVDGIPVGEANDGGVGLRVPKWTDLLRCCTGLCRKKRGGLGTEVYDSGVKPSNRLVIIVVVVSFLMAMCVVGTAVAVNWTSTVKRNEDFLVQELNLMRNAAEFFSLTQGRVQTAESLQSTAAILGRLISLAGYGHGTEDFVQNAEDLVGDVADIIGSLFLQTAEERMMQNARLVGAMYDSLYAQGYWDEVVNTTNFLNSEGMPAAWEVVLGKKINGSVAFLSNLKFASICAPNCGQSPDSAIPMRRALNQSTGSVLGPDYSNQMVVAGHTYIAGPAVGLVFKCKLETLQTDFLVGMAAAVDRMNRQSTDSSEIMLLKGTNTSFTILTALNKTACGVWCTPQAMAAALTGASKGSFSGLDYRGEKVFAAYEVIEELGVTVVLKVDLAQILGDLLTGLGTAVAATSFRMPESREILLGNKVVLPNGTITVPFLTPLKYGNQCAGGVCKASQALRIATLNCTTGYLLNKDYRGVSVLAGYGCIPEIQTGILVKMDDSDVMADCLADFVQYADNRNSDSSQQGLAASLNLIIAEQKAGSASIQGPSDVQFLTESQGTACEDGKCFLNGGSWAVMRDALNGKEGIARFTDYSGQSVIAAYTLAKGFLKGLQLTIDLNDVQQPMFSFVGILIGIGVGIVIFGIALLGLAARNMLAKMMDTWQKGKEAVERQKQQFGNLISALYPRFASERLMDGDRQIVLQLPEGTIFFSDIYNFTMTSNLITAQELIEWIGYTFGVMDAVAEEFAVYKIKTIGDAFFGISGLPGMIPENDPMGGHAVRMLHFASCCAQIFSTWYTHPDKGLDLQEIAARGAALLQPKSTKQSAMTSETSDKKSEKERRSSMGGTSLHSAATSSYSKVNENAKCPMRYGLASGPVVTGVLHGKCPAFDAWGKTVILASRMEQTGQPGRVQCSESVYNAARQVPNSPYDWEKPHTTFVKGFGNVSSFMVKGTSMNPPEHLLDKLQLDHPTGYFCFEEAIKATANTKTPREPGSSNTSSTKQATKTPRMRLPSKGQVLVKNFSDPDIPHPGGNTSPR